MPFDRIRLFGLIALLMARVTLTGYDPNQLSMTGSSGGLIINFLTLLFWVVSVARDKQLHWGTVAQRLFCVGLLGLVAVTILSAQIQDCYKRPSFFIAAEILSLAAFAHLIVQQCRNVTSIRTILNVIVACTIMQAGTGCLQEIEVFPVTAKTKSPVGFPEFYEEIDFPRVVLRGSKYSTPPYDEDKYAEQVQGTLPNPATLFGVALLGGIPLMFTAYQSLRTRRGLLSLVLVLLTFLGGFAAYHGIDWDREFDYIAEAIQKSVWFGVGPGCWSRHTINQRYFPGSFLLGNLATTGLLVLIPFGIIGYAFFKGLRQPVLEEAESISQKRPAWEVYLGAMFGLTWGFVWLTGELPVDMEAQTLWFAGLHAIIRAAVWYTSYAILERVALKFHRIKRVLTLTFILSLIVLLVGRTFYYPQASWLIVGYTSLALAIRTQPSSSPLGRTRRGFLLSGGIVLLGLEFLLVTRPGVNTLQTVREARIAGLELAQLDEKVKAAPGEGTKREAQKRLARFIGENISQPLRDACRLDHRNATLRRELVKWDRWEWYYVRHSDPAKALKITDEVASVMKRVEYLDPKHPANAETEFAALIVFIAGSTTDIEKRIESAQRCIAAMAQVYKDSEVGNRYKLADALLVPSHRVYAILEIKKINELVEIEGQPHGSLKQEQRQTMQKKLADLVNPKK